MNNPTSPAPSALSLPSPSAADRLVRRSPRPMALEQRFMFDGAAAADAAETVDAAPAANLLAVAATDAPPVVTQAEAMAEQAVAAFLSQPDVQARLFDLFHGGQSEPSAQWQQAVDALLAELSSDTAALKVELRSDQEMEGALGAFAAAGVDGRPTIYLNRDWLDAGAGADWVARVLTEELGHSIDARLNPGGDTPGDEGQAFAAAVMGEDSTAPGFATDEDHTTLQLDGVSVDVEKASLSFANAYAVNTATTPAGKETNSHDFVFTGLGTAEIDDDTNSRYFSGNDVSAIGINIGGQTYYGWISRPIKVGGIVRGFYFWTDADFTTLAAAQADGNTDGDRDVTDNQGFILVVDQAYFNSLGWKDMAANLKNIGSSSDRVDSALNSLVEPYVAPVATADLANGTPGAAGGAAVEAGGANNASTGADAFGNVLLNDTGEHLALTSVGTTSANQAVSTASTSASNGTAVNGQYGTLTIGADGSYVYVVDNANAAVEALRGSGDTLADRFTYTVTDGAGVKATTTLTVTVRGANDDPAANDDYNVAKESIAVSGQYTSSDTTGARATGNVLDNDGDPDRYGETKAILDVGATATATGSSRQNDGTTTLSFTTLPSNVSVGYYVFLDGNGVDDDKTPGLLLTDANNTAITIVAIDTVAKTFTLSGTVANTSLSANQLLGFANQSTGSGAYKDAYISAATSGSTTVDLSAYSGNIAVGMTVEGTGLSTPPTVTAINYDGSGAIASIQLSSPVDFTNRSLTFSSGANAGVSLTGQYGTLLLNADGSYTYTPTANNPALSEGQSAVEAFQYTMRDAAGAESSATFYITVRGSGTNDPDAVADTANATEAGGVANGTAGVDPTGNLLANDTTPSGSNTIVSARSADASGDTAISGSTQIVGRYGTLTIAPDGSYTYAVANANPAVQALNASDTLTDTFIYTIGNGLSAGGNPLRDSAVLTVTLHGANDAPVAADVTATAIEAGGTGNAIPSFDPSGNVLEHVADVDDALSDLRITAVRTGGVEGTGTAGTVGSALAGAYGTLTLNADGSWSYAVGNGNPAVNALAPGQTLTESFNYTVTDRSGSGLSDIAVLTITIQGASDTVAVNSVFVNEASPYAVFAVTGAEGVAVTLALGDTTGLADSDARATLSGPAADLGSQLEYFDGATWHQYDAGNPPVLPSGGVLLVRVAVLQDTVHEGNESFTLTATTADGGSSIGIGTIGDEGEGDIFLAGNTTGTPNATGDAGYPAVDDDRPTLSVSSPTLTEGGTAEFTVSIDKLSTADIGFTPSLASGLATVGTDTAAAATLQVSTDGGLNWSTVSGPVTIAAGESSVKLRIATVDDAEVEPDETFTLSTGFISGTVTNPDGATGTATITDNDTPTPGNQAPTAADDALTTAEDTALTIAPATLLANDSDVDGDTLTIVSVQDAQHGTVALVGGQVVFTPAPNYHGPASFTYTVSDGNGGTATATVSIDVTPVNDGPAAADDALSTAEDTALTIAPATLLANDSDVDGDTLTIVSVQDAQHGTVALVGGQVVFTPAPNYHGAASFTYTVSDGNGGTATATVSIDVTPVNDGPAAADDALTTAEDTALTIAPATLLANDSDVDGDTLTIVSVQDAQHGTVALVGGQVVFTPAQNYHGPASFTYTVSDGNGGTTTATVHVSIAPVNDAPVAAPASISTPHGTAIGGSLPAASDPDGDPVTYAKADDPAHGTVTIAADGRYTYTPAPGYGGPDSFTYTVSDGHGGSNTYTVSITVGAPPPVPPVLAPEAPPPAPAPLPPDTEPDAAPNPFTGLVQSFDAPIAPRYDIIGTVPEDMLTSSSGFRVAVVEATQPTLTIYRGVGDQYADAGSRSSFTIPYDTFAHTDPNERIVLAATQADGRALPAWVRFDPQSGNFEYDAPDDFHGELVIKVTARDSKGREVSALFRFTVGQKAIDKGGRAALSEQLRHAAQRNGVVFSLPATPPAAAGVRAGANTA